MDLARLDFIETRVTKNRSAPDLDELALELCAELRKRMAPPVSPSVIVPPPPEAAPVVDVPPADAPPPVDPPKDPDATPAASPKSKRSRE